MASDDERFLHYMRSSLLFHESLASASSMKEAVDIARDHGFDIDEALIRATLADRGEPQDLDDDDLTEVRGGASENSDTSSSSEPTGMGGW
ncbi:Nif11-like leader peptide family natural product precursor [Candidatus Nanopelagicales bacterium]|nr:Nif11-like leader peptide family natural product precursor [Candidatus Nanopelagicales bacterium]